MHQWIPWSSHQLKSGRSQSHPVKPAPPGGSDGPRAPRARHAAVAWGGSKATEQLLHGSCLTWSSFPTPKKGVFPCPCHGVSSGGEQQLHSHHE